MSLMSYIIGGPLILIVQQLFPERSGTDCAECGNYLRLVFSFVAIALSTASSLIVLLLHCIDGLREKSRRQGHIQLWLVHTHFTVLAERFLTDYVRFMLWSMIEPPE